MLAFKRIVWGGDIKLEAVGSTQSVFRKEDGMKSANE